MKKNFNFTRVCSLVLAVVMTLTLVTVAFAAEKKYTIDLQSVPEQEFLDSRVTIKFELTGRDPIVVSGSDDMGYPVLMNVPNLGGVTLIPIRIICESLGLSVGWNNATAEKAAHAVIGTPKYGDVELYMGATSINANGTTYKEETYCFPDGSPIPLCLNRNGRIYVPVRFLTTFVVDGATYKWSQNMTTLTITGSMEGGSTTTNAWNGVGVNANKQFDPENPLDGMPNTKAVVEKYNLGVGADLVSLSVNRVGLRNNMGADTMVLEGFTYSANDQDRYDTAIALLKDILDAESANAFIKWIEELDKLQGELKQAIINDDSTKEASLEAALNAHRAPLKENYVSFGNIEVKWQTEGNVISLYMRNKK